MLLYLERGLFLYGIGMVLFLGLCSKWLANHTYNRLLLQTENGLSQRNECLRQFCRQYETVYRSCGKVQNPSVLVEKQMGQLKVLGIRLYRMENLLYTFSLICFLIGTGSSLIAFLQNGSGTLIVEHFAAGILAGIVLITAESACDTSAKRSLLFTQIQNYFENVLYAQMSSSDTAEKTSERKAVKAMKDDIFMERKQANKGAEEEAQEEVRRRTMADVLQAEADRRKAAEEESLHKEDYLSRERNQDIAALKQSLEQIAASREHGSGGNGRKLTAEEEQLMEEIISEYFKK